MDDTRTAAAAAAAAAAEALAPAHPPAEHGSPRKRRRVVISCIPCHRRKQKCDRELPCANCRGRNRESSCNYDPGAPTARDHELYKAAPPVSRDGRPSRRSEPLSSMAATWGYGQTGPSTIGFLKKIETADADFVDGPSGTPTRGPKHQSFAIREKYKGFIRQLPAKVYIDRLITMFLAEFNWQYGFVEPDVFFKQLDEWHNLPFSVLSSEGPLGLSPDLRVFPAVLFQVIATALLLISDGQPSEFDGLKYTASMTFEDLASEYSESGAAIVSLFGKRDLSITTVQAEFLHASFSKFTANVTESWHMIGVAIRDAQELGMHRDSLDPKPRDDSLESVLENQWHIQRRRKMYMMLVIWDINMCLILGRPGTVDWRHGLPSIPVDALPPSDRSTTPVVQRHDDKDPPTPLTRGLWLHALTLPLREIQDLEQDGPYPKDFYKVDMVHHHIMELNDQKPAAFRLNNPDTRWDNVPGTVWIKSTRLYVAQLHEFSLMALHRPYIFHRKESRVEALRASVEMLELQRLFFEGLPPEAWRNFLLFFGSFDAIVLIASIYILFPHEHPELRDNCTQKVYWAIERFAAMQDRNPLAKAAQGVLRAILAKFTRAVDSQGRSSSTADSSSETPASTRARASLTPASSLGKAPGDLASCDAAKATMAQAPQYPAAFPPPADWSLPPADSLAAIAPLFPTSDLLYHDLTAIQDDSIVPLVAPTSLQGAGDEAALGPDVLPWQFGGGFGEDTVWQVLNQFQPLQPQDRHAPA